MLSKDKMSKKDQAKVMDEVDLLRKVDHPNIAKYFETYDDKHYLYLVMELCMGGELFDSHDRCVKNGQPYTERMAADVMKKCLSALQHCHSLGITHRDIKPENIMFGRDGEVRLGELLVERLLRGALVPAEVAPPGARIGELVAKVLVVLVPAGEDDGVGPVDDWIELTWSVAAAG